MRVFGIDCGTEFTGFGVVEMREAVGKIGCEAVLVPLVHGTIRLNKRESTAQRLAEVHTRLSELIVMHEPDCVAIEEVFYSVNAKSALKLGQVRGAALLAAANCGMTVAEYAPLTIKSSVVGYGLAKKEQVQFMVMRLLGLSEAPETMDASDALAIAICHIHTAQTEMRQKESGEVQAR
jgi:crossover junction endodeoxyribonuclease RuvC